MHTCMLQGKTKAQSSEKHTGIRNYNKTLL